jgi:hypothetical protein
MVSGFVLAALLALPAETPPPATRAGPSFACRMAHPSGDAFTLAGAFGAGRRFASPTAGGSTSWGYVFDEAMIADSEIRFSGRAMEARTSTVDPHAANARFELRIAYPRTGGGMELIIRERGSGGHSARLIGYRHEEPVASGTCTLGAGAEIRL